MTLGRRAGGLLLAGALLGAACGGGGSSDSGTRGQDGGGNGDQIFFQGHAAPGMYARAFLEGRLSEEQLDHFRREALAPGKGLPSYPHPRTMPDFSSER